MSYNRYEPVYTETELLDVYQDLLNTQVQTPEPAASVVDEFEEGTNDRTSVHSLIKRLNEHLPPEPETSQSHKIGVHLREPMARYRWAISRVAALLEYKDIKTEHPDPSCSQNMAKQKMLPSPPEWAALIRECVSTLDDETSVHRFRFSRSA